MKKPVVVLVLCIVASSALFASLSVGVIGGYPGIGGVEVDYTIKDNVTLYANANYVFGYLFEDTEYEYYSTTRLELAKGVNAAAGVECKVLSLKNAMNDNDIVIGKLSVGVMAAAATYLKDGFSYTIAGTIKGHADVKFNNLPATLFVRAFAGVGTGPTLKAPLGEEGMCFAYGGQAGILFHF